MKKICYLLIAVISAFTACKKDDLVETTPYTKIEVGDPAYSFLRFINVTPGSPNINYYLNNTRFTGAYNALSGETGFGYNTIFPNLSGQYLPITPGANKIDAKIVSSATVDKDLNVLTANINTNAGKYYTLFTTGTYNTTDKKITSSYLLEEVRPVLDTTKVFVRLVNLYSGGPAAIDMIQRSTGQVLISGVAYGSASPFIEIPLPGQANIYQFNNAGTVTPVSPGQLTATLTKGQAYTFILRGVAGSTTTPFSLSTYTSFY
ncbi:DUF4397 domain-containing protein [Pedobacter sp. CFBP9032]|uniref:DUF4397 domain-containing protein n=1 Tax=Pedobacter sp. CFBP9032 TaxID=3096539 RepID=UPI002A6A7B33|nr:DUF4397 domain-containing protein [Pedobacter sp. CFBP9032]MDY0905379.1 DUF4397 domain-containing protein [Pedobacter sp. CFBP9032]